MLKKNDQAKVFNLSGLLMKVIIIMNRGMGLACSLFFVSKPWSVQPLLNN
jgi:hypothetical protein